MTSAERRSADAGLRLMLHMVEAQYSDPFARAIIKAQIEYVIGKVAFASNTEVRAAMETLQSGVLVAERMLGIKP